MMNLLELERSMKELLNQRTVYLKKSVQADVELNSLYSEETGEAGPDSRVHQHRERQDDRPRELLFRWL